MDLEFRGVLAPTGLATHANLITPPASSSDLRSTPRLPRPVTGFDFASKNLDSCGMEKIPAITGKRRGGCRKACNECKQQKVS